MSSATLTATQAATRTTRTATRTPWKVMHAALGVSKRGAPIAAKIVRADFGGGASAAL